MSKRIRVGLIGCGSIGQFHAERYAKCPLTELAWTADILPDRAAQTAKKHGARKHSTDYREMLEDTSVGAVSVCLPNDLHCPVSIDALRSGKHVLCEKPIALNMAEAEKMMAAAKESGRMLVIGTKNRFDSYVNLVKELIASGKLGNVYHVSTVFKYYRLIPGLGGWFTTRARSGGGVMADWGIHFLDLILYTLGFPNPRSVVGVAHSQLGKNLRQYAYIDMWAGPPEYDGIYDVEEYVSGLLRTDGPSISFEGAWAQNVNERRMHIDFLGDKGGIRLNYGSAFTLYWNEKGTLYEAASAVRDNDPYYNEISSFAACILDSTTSPADIESVMVTQRVIDAFYASAARGVEVAVQEA